MLARQYWTTWFLAFWCATIAIVDAFVVPAVVKSRFRQQDLSARGLRLIERAEPSSSQHQQPDEENEENDKGGIGDKDDDDDLLFMESFRQAANSKLGSPIPTSNFVEETANRAENDFLKAMQSAKEEFAQAKEKSDGNVDDAIEMIMNKIQKEEDLLAKLEKEITTRNDDSDGSTQNEGDNDNKSSFQ